jgi:hypothetical protein
MSIKRNNIGALATRFNHESKKNSNSNKNASNEIRKDFSIFKDIQLLNNKYKFNDLYDLFNDSIKIFETSYDEGTLDKNKKQNMKDVFDKYLCLMTYLCEIKNNKNNNNKLVSIIKSLLKLKRNIGRGIISRVLYYLHDNSEDTLAMLVSLINDSNIEIPGFNKKSIPINISNNNNFYNSTNFNNLKINNNMKNNIKYNNYIRKTNEAFYKSQKLENEKQNCIEKAKTFRKLHPIKCMTIGNNKCKCSMKTNNTSI